MGVLASKFCRWKTNFLQIWLLNTFKSNPGIIMLLMKPHFSERCGQWKYKVHTHKYTYGHYCELYIYIHSSYKKAVKKVTANLSCPFVTSCSIICLVIIPIWRMSGEDGGMLQDHMSWVYAMSSVSCIKVD